MLQRTERASHQFKLFDVVALKVDVVEPGHSFWGGAVPAGSLGTIVDFLRDDVYLVEFSNEDGEAFAILTLRDEVMSLHWASPS